MATHKVLQTLDSGAQSLVLKEVFGQCSRFDAALWQAIELADKDNLVLLRKAYPFHVAAWDHYKYTQGWWDNLRHKIITASQMEVVDPN